MPRPSFPWPMHSLRQLLSIIACQSIHAVMLNCQTAAPKHCSLHSLQLAHTAACTHCSSQTLQLPNTAACTHCSLHSLQLAHTAACILAHYAARTHCSSYKPTPVLYLSNICSSHTVTRKLQVPHKYASTQRRDEHTVHVAAPALCLSTAP